MTIAARAAFSRDKDSARVGQALGEEIRAGLGGEAPKLVVAYLTVNHDQRMLLGRLQQTLGDATWLVGCSAQGVMTTGVVSEHGYAAGAIGLGGSGTAYSAARVEQIQEDTLEKGAALGRTLTGSLAGKPKIAVLLYDPLCGADMNLLLAGLDAELACPVIGGAAGHYYGPMRSTFQYFGRDVFGHGAVAFAISGSFDAELGITSGVSATGIEMAVTKCEGNKVLELDGRRALDVWEEITSAGPPNSDHTAALALGVPVEGSPESGEHLIRAAFGVDAERGGVVLQAGIPEGTRVMLHHRTVDDVEEGTRKMGRALRRRIGERRVHAVLGFECGARTTTFLGEAAVQRENVELQQTVAPHAQWLGLTTWGEIYPVCGKPGFHNYTYPLLALVE